MKKRWFGIFLFFIWVIFLFGSASERMCTRVTKLNCDAIEVAVEIIDSNNRYVWRRLSLRVTIQASQEENQRNFPLTSLVWLPRLILALRVCRWRNSHLVKEIREFTKKFSENHWNSEILPKSFVENCQFKASRCWEIILKASKLFVGCSHHD